MSVREYAPNAPKVGPTVKTVEVAVEVLTTSFLGQGLAGQLCQPGDRVVIDVPVDDEGKPVIGANLRLLANGEPTAAELATAGDAPPVAGAVKAGDMWLVPDGEGRFKVWSAEADDESDPLLAAAKAAGQQAPLAQATAPRNADLDADDLDGKTVAELRALHAELGGKPLSAAVKREDILAEVRKLRAEKAQATA